MIRGWKQTDEWYYFWSAIVSHVIGAWDAERNNTNGGWIYFPFAGGYYDQEKYNVLTWEIWNHIIITYYAELKEYRENTHGDGNNPKD